MSRTQSARSSGPANHWNVDEPMIHLQPSARAEQRFDLLAVQSLADPTVTQGTGFGSSPGLRTTGKIFAMLVNSELVVKLPKARVDQLVASGTGGRFDPGHGRLMKEWATVALDSSESWERLAAEALQFVGSAVKSPRGGGDPSSPRADLSSGLS
jgi:TfoX/Sxy family transcriptional regulator of competence genes